MRNLLLAHFWALFSFFVAMIIAGLTGKDSQLEFLLIWGLAAAVIGTTVSEGALPGARLTIFLVSLAYIGAALAGFVTIGESGGWFPAALAGALLVAGTVFAAKWEQRRGAPLAPLVLGATPVAGPFTYGVRACWHRMPLHAQQICGNVLMLSIFAGVVVLLLALLG